MTFNQIRSILTSKSYEIFDKWVSSQILDVNNNGEFGIDIYDFNKWVKELINNNVEISFQVKLD